MCDGVIDFGIPKPKLEKPQPRQVLREAPGYVWLAGWYATKLHATRKELLRLPANGDYGSIRAECGAWVYKKPRTAWAAKKMDKGIPHCKHCERILNT